MPESFDELLDRATRAMNAGYHEQALGPATDAAKASPNRWEARLILARAWMAQKHAERALNDARATLELAQGRLPAEALRETNDVIARASLALGDNATAEATLRGLCMDDVRSAVRLVALLAAQGRREEAGITAGQAAAAHAAWAPRFREAAAAIANAAASEEAELALADLEIDADLLEEARLRLQSVFAKSPENERAQEGLRVIAGGGRPPPKAPRPARASAGTRHLFRNVIFAAGILLLVAGIATAVWVKMHAEALVAAGVDPRRGLVAGAALIVAAIWIFAIDQRGRAREKQAAQQTGKAA